MSDLVYLDQADARYPSALKSNLAANAPPTIAARGALEFLQHDLLALFCSAKCPGNLILRAFDVARHLRDARQTVISGFHSPLEQEMLTTILLRGTSPIIICPARTLDAMRLPAAWHAPLREKRLLLLSPFSDARHKRITAPLAAKRNQFVAALAARILIIHAAASGNTIELARALVKRQTQDVLTLPVEENRHLLEIGVKPFTLHA